MAHLVRDVMTKRALSLSPDATLLEAARLMRDKDVGDVLVVAAHRVLGILTDRDIAVRAVAMGHDPYRTPLRSVCSPGVRTVRPDQDTEEAARLMRAAMVRRLAVVEDGRVRGVVTLGDLARADDPRSTLADISAAPPNSGA
ncbi:CBS domain-containing protein [Streptomyces sp. SCSIO 30461]|uniref:CBS domain-containing protein n=1 Tax=Streptomyces sp. SCSIO 30461 TaxID=3118085 RepID=UPI0030D048CC